MMKIRPYGAEIEANAIHYRHTIVFNSQRRIENKTHDSWCATEPVENSMKKAEAEGIVVKEVIADTGYDTHEIFGIKPVIKVRRKAVITSKRTVVRAIREGKKKWRKANGYGRRWHVESFLSSFKYSANIYESSAGIDL